MDSGELLQKYSPFFRRYWFPLLLGVLGLIFLGYGMTQYMGGRQDKEDILFDGVSTSSSNVSNFKDGGAQTEIAGSDKQNLKPGNMVVDIEGAVQKPGVYKLSYDARVQDLLIAADGLGKDADREKVAKSLNLAAKLTDGAKIYIPFNGEGSVMGEATNGPININSASVSDLDSLPGIGKITANKIIANRPYGNIEELVAKKIVGQKVFEEIKEKISVY